MKRMCVILVIMMMSLVTTAVGAQAPETVSAWVTIQPFERGMMLYRTDTGLIWVLSDGGTVKSFASATYGKLRDNRIKTSATGRLPQFGFGKVWGNYATVRRLIGAPTDTEGGRYMTISNQGGVYTLTQSNGTVYTIRGSTWKSAYNPTVYQNPRVNSLTANAMRTRVGNPLEISWSVSDANLALVEIYDGATNQNLFYFDAMPLTGTTSISVPSVTTGALRIVVTAVVLMPVTNQYEWRAAAEILVFVDGAQPVMNTVTTYAAYQSFQNGFMIWRSDTDDVLVFINGSGVTAYTDPGSLPTPATVTPPSGLIMPINAFGRAWGGADLYIGQQIGWATGAEQGYQTTVSTPENSYWPTVMTLPGGRTITLDVAGRTWSVQ